MRHADLYKLLGVARGADQEAIDKAFRRKSRKLHPDRGGNEEKFKQLQFAHEVLSDPDKRKRYDDTGSTDGLGADQKTTRAMELLFNLMAQVLRGHIQAGSMLDQIDCAASLLARIRKNKADALSEMENLRRAKKELEVVAARFETEDQVNLLRQIVENHIVKVDHDIKVMQAACEDHIAAEEIVKRYKYRFDKMEFASTHTVFSNRGYVQFFASGS